MSAGEFYQKTKQLSLRKVKLHNFFFSYIQTFIYFFDIDIFWGERYDIATKEGEINRHYS